MRLIKILGWALCVLAAASGLAASEAAAKVNPLLVQYPSMQPLLTPTR